MVHSLFKFTFSVKKGSLTSCTTDLSFQWKKDPLMWSFRCAFSAHFAHAKFSEELTISALCRVPSMGTAHSIWFGTIIWRQTRESMLQNRFSGSNCWIFLLWVQVSAWPMDGDGCCGTGCSDTGENYNLYSGRNGSVEWGLCVREWMGCCQLSSVFSSCFGSYYLLHRNWVYFYIPFSLKQFIALVLPLVSGWEALISESFK